MKILASALQTLVDDPDIREARVSTRIGLPTTEFQTFVMPVEAIAVTLIGYLLGSIPFGVLVARNTGLISTKLAAETQEQLIFYEKLENQLAIWFSFLIP